jgi:hypothetical protein
MEPCSFRLGQRSLHVVDILERGGLADARRFQVRVADGDRWELAAVMRGSR